jgi:uncharacterized protein DUF5681
MATTRKAPPTAFKPGQSGNPKGRPRGVRNKATLAALALMTEEAESITRVAVEAALGGDLVAVRLILDRLVPPAKERHVVLRGFPDTSTAAGISAASVAVLEAVAAGELTPGEGSAMASLLESRRKALETQELEARIAALENSDTGKGA